MPRIQEKQISVLFNFFVKQFVFKEINLYFMRLIFVKSCVLAFPIFPTITDRLDAVMACFSCIQNSVCLVLKLGGCSVAWFLFVIKTLRVALFLCHESQVWWMQHFLVFFCVQNPCVALTVCPRFQIWRMQDSMSLCFVKTFYFYFPRLQIKSI